MLSQDFIQEMQAKLLQEQETLKNDLAGLSEHSEVGDDLDENATELQIDEVSQNQIERMTTDLAKVEKALQKIEAGTYGTDDDGNEIGEDRLRAIPWADKAI
jgi:RNA polymerase-binding transcription factor DksA